MIKDLWKFEQTFHERTYLKKNVKASYLKKEKFSNGTFAI